MNKLKRWHYLSLALISHLSKGAFTDKDCATCLTDGEGGRWCLDDQTYTSGICCDSELDEED